MDQDGGPIFKVEINGTTYNDLLSARAALDAAWSEYKAPLVAAQLEAVRNKKENPAAAHAATGAVLDGADA